MKTLLLSLLVTVFLFPFRDAFSQRRKSNKKSVAVIVSYDTAYYASAIRWRSIGPFRGGRSAAVTGVLGKPLLFYFGATGGGVWRTKDGGNTWENISDGYFGGSIGSIEVSASDNNVIYVGGGEVTVRGNVSYGYGVWKSVDAGKTWFFSGLPNSKHIPRIRVHPDNPDLVYAAVLGDLFKSSNERGVYRSKDGGKTWKKILFANADAGAVDLTFDSSNPRILYATTWRVRRTPHSLESGGKGSALWKSIDGGDTWKNISANAGLPKGLWGIAGVTVSPRNSERVWAIIENKAGGVFRSDNAGKTWKKVNDTRALRQRAWYYTRIYADTKDEDIVYVLNVDYHKSTDSGKTFKAYRAPHGDHHDLWIAPEDNQRIIVGDDGGAQVSFDGGNNWTSYHNQPTAQFYRVTTDNAFPYRIYGAQQDNSTVRIAHRTVGTYITSKDWEATAGGESAHIAIHPKNNDLVYGGSYGGFLTRIDHTLDEVTAVNVWPDNPMGYGAEGMKYRFQWNFPIFFSPYNPNVLYTTSNRWHKSTNGGQSWEIISPDLTRNDSTKLVSSGGSITKDNTGVEYYATVFAATESRVEKGLLWSGSDDGLIYISRNGGQDWQNVTPANLPEWMMINSIEVDPFVEGGAYVAGTRYKMGDYQPYIYVTKDYGKIWTKKVSGIDRNDFTRVVRADPKREGLLYAGTESGVYVSFDDGASWSSLQLNLPIVPITDLAVKNDNLIAATQGRSFWLIDDLTVLHQLNDQVGRTNFYLYQPMPSYRMGGGQVKESRTAGQNHPGGVMVHFWLANEDTSQVLTLSFLEEDGDTIKTFSTHAKEKKNKLKVKKGGNCFVWDMRYQDAQDFEGMVMWWGSMAGPKAVPGNYRVNMCVGDNEQTRNFAILSRPNSSASKEDMQAQFDFLMKTNSKVSEAHMAIRAIRKMKKQVQGFLQRVAKDSTRQVIMKKAKNLIEQATEIEKTLYQTQNRSRQDPLNFPIRLTNKLAHLNSLTQISDNRPTVQAEAVRAELTKRIDEQLSAWKQIREQQIPTLNRLIRESAIDFISSQE